MNRFDNNRGSRSGQNMSSPRSSESQALTVAYYKDPEQKILNPDLLDIIAEKQADALHSKINSSQVRRFFGEVKSIYHCLQEGKKWPELEPRFRMIKSRAFYAVGTRRIPREFSDFLIGNINQVKTENDFKAFVQYFEAVLGFMYGKGLVAK